MLVNVCTRRHLVSPPVLDSVEHISLRVGLHRVPVEYIVKVLGHKVNFSIPTRRASFRKMDKRERFVLITLQFISMHSFYLVFVNSYNPVLLFTFQHALSAHPPRMMTILLYRC